MSVKRTERGWAGHFIDSHKCAFRRNTLLEKDGVFIVVSTVGNYERGQIGADRYYETMAFYSDVNDTKYHDADVSREFPFESKRAICNYNYYDNEANDMHEAVVREIMEKMEKGPMIICRKESW